MPSEKMRIVVFGNSGSGKSRFAQNVSQAGGLAYLDLDTVAWTGKKPPQRLPIEESQRKIQSFVESQRNWIIEGCYASLIDFASAWASNLIFLNPGTETCLSNCRSRPWEPHKYPSKDAQDENLEMLLKWVSEYESRDDEYSYREHRRILDEFQGRKTELRSNIEGQAYASKLIEALHPTTG